jgi:hypothetical protein
VARDARTALSAENLSHDDQISSSLKRDGRSPQSAVGSRAGRRSAPRPSGHSAIRRHCADHLLRKASPHGNGRHGPGPGPVHSPRERRSGSGARCGPSTFQQPRGSGITGGVFDPRAGWCSRLKCLDALRFQRLAIPGPGHSAQQRPGLGPASHARPPHRTFRPRAVAFSRSRVVDQGFRGVSGLCGGG